MARWVVPLILVGLVVATVALTGMFQSHNPVRCAKEVRTQSFGPDTPLNPPQKPTPEEAMNAFLVVYRPLPSGPIPPVSGYRLYKRTPSLVTFLHKHDAAVDVALGGNTSGTQLGPHPVGEPGSPWAVAQLTVCAS
jgi:hypothetical protein